MSFSGPFNLPSDGLLAAPPMISNCSNLPFGTQGRSYRLETVPYKQERGDRKASMPRRSTGFCSVSLSYINSTYFELYITGIIYSLWCLDLSLNIMNGVLYSRNLCIPITRKYLLLQIEYNIFIYSSFSVHLGYNQLLVSVHNVTMKIHVYVLLNMFILICWVYTKE